MLQISIAAAAPRSPATDQEVLAELPPGLHHAEPSRAAGLDRIDVALPLAKIYVARARMTGDLRFLGYAEALLEPWMRSRSPPPAVLVLHATILQSRHAFEASLLELDRALAASPNDAQAWLTRATVLRVLGRYDAALASCRHLEGSAEPRVARLCEQSILGLTGHLRDAYLAILQISPEALSAAVAAWRCSELGEMAERLGDDTAAERHFRSGLDIDPRDFYTRLAYADLLLRHGRAAETLTLLADDQTMEPMLLRIALAHRQLHDAEGARAEALLAGAFEVEERRGDAVHRREEARFLLDVRHDPRAALEAAIANWAVQHEPDDALILARAARAAGQPDAAEPMQGFLRAHGFQDARLSADGGAS
jgi:tetratricopeptide (TPR) repeat protein